MVGKTLVQQRRQVNPEMLKDPDIELKSLVSGQSIN
jgi:3-phenylpropionate/trans-cinnamate dioxygenase ferredoxin reductase subunit